MCNVCEAMRRVIMCSGKLLLVVDHGRKTVEPEGYCPVCFSLFPTRMVGGNAR